MVFSIAKRANEKDKLIYPDSPTVSRMLRLAQFKLVAGGDNSDSDEISETVAALLKESTSEEDRELNVIFEVLALGTVLATLGIADNIPIWFDLILLMKAVIDSSDTEYDLSSFSAARSEAGASNYSMLFCVGVARISSVKRQEEIFISLDALTQDQRSLLLEAYERQPGDYHVFVSAPLARRAAKGDLDWRDAASRYAEYGVDCASMGN